SRSLITIAPVVCEEKTRAIPSVIPLRSSSVFTSSVTSINSAECVVVKEWFAITMRIADSLQGRRSRHPSRPQQHSSYTEPFERSNRLIGQLGAAMRRKAPERDTVERRPTHGRVEATV